MKLSPIGVFTLRPSIRLDKIIFVKLNPTV